MLRRISLIAASAAMVALSALPASAAPMQSSTHKLSFPALHGVQAWGSYVKLPKFVRVAVCARDTARGNYAVGAVTVGYNARGNLHTNLGAVAIGYNQTVCRTGILRYTAHMKIYTFIGTNKGTIAKRSRLRKVY
jgi:phosphoribosylcarboxyaminoimidazole (NCAIR) mutase